jgi:superfamily I DNA and RNA helicase
MATGRSCLTGDERYTVTTNARKRLVAHALRCNVYVCMVQLLSGSPEWTIGGFVHL